MDIANYKGYQIHATPYQLADTGEWKINLHIVVQRNDEIKSREFGAGNRYKTREEAVRYCFNFGKQIIDSQVAKCPVADLCRTDKSEGPMTFKIELE